MTVLIGMGILAFLLVFLQASVYRRRWNRSLRAGLSFAEHTMMEGEYGELYEVVENKKLLPLPLLRIKFSVGSGLVFGREDGARVTDMYYRNDMLHVNSYEKFTRTFRFQAKRRGYYKIDNMLLIARDLFLAEELLEEYPQENCYLYVYPKPYTCPELSRSLKQLMGEIIARRHMLEDPFEHRGIREYQSYDDIRNVNWKATAKTGQLKINQKNFTSMESIRIFFDVEDKGFFKKTDAVNLTLRMVAGIAFFFATKGIRTSVYGNSVDILSGEMMLVEPGAGAGQMEKINRALARVDLSKEGQDFTDALGKRFLEEEPGTVTLVVSSNSHNDFMELLREKGDNYCWIYPSYGKAEKEWPPWVGEHITQIPVRREGTR